MPFKIIVQSKLRNGQNAHFYCAIKFISSSLSMGEIVLCDDVITASLLQCMCERVLHMLETQFCASHLKLLKKCMQHAKVYNGSFMFLILQ